MPIGREGGMLTGSGDQTPAPTPAPSTSSDRTYTYVRESGDLRGGDTRNIWTATQVNTVSGHSGLRDLYNSRKEYQQIFGSVDNYIAYMDQMYDLQQNNPEVFRWWENTGMSAEEWAQANGYPAADGLDPRDQEAFDREFYAYQQETAQQAYEAMFNSEEYQALSSEYGLDTPVKNADGDVFMFNGGFPVEIAEIDDHMSATDYARIAAAVGLGFVMGPAVSNALGGGLVGGAVSGVANSAVSQLITTGEIDPSNLAPAAVSGAFQGIADAAAAGESLSGIETAIDNATWDLAGALGIDYDTASNIISSGSQSLLAGGSVADTAASVVGQFGADVLLANLDLGDLSVEVDNLFREGVTEIPHDAIQSIIADGMTAVLSGEASWSDVLTGYFEEGGSLDFLLPDMPEGDFLDVDLPDVDLPFDLNDIPTPDEDLSDIEYPDVNEWVDAPEVDVPVDLNDIPTPDEDLSDVEYPDVNELVNAPDVDIDTPDVDIDVPSIPSLTRPRTQIPQFNESSVSLGYRPVQLQQQITSPSIDYMASLTPLTAPVSKRELDGMLIRLAEGRNA